MSKSEEINFHKATELIIRISLVIAYCDRKFHDSESKIIKQWIKQRIEEEYSDQDKKREIKNTYDNIFKESIQLANNDQLRINQLCKELRQLESQRSQIAAMDLAVQIMTADNIIHHNEIFLIHKVSNLLGISHDEVMKITNSEILKMGKVPEKIDIERLLGIDPTVSNKKANKWFEKLDDTWHGATTSTRSGVKRKIAEKMYDEVSKAWEKYTVS
jgi:hypothetical protein